jgi:hypothetical protein
MSYFTCLEIRLPNKSIQQFINENTNPITRFWSIDHLENCHENHLPWKENYGLYEHKTKINDRTNRMD